jgi:hypothetical protein
VGDVGREEGEVDSVLEKAGHVVHDQPLLDLIALSRRLP